MWPEQQVAGPGALAAASRWERLRRPNQLQQLGLRGWQVPDWEQLRRGPLLLLLHGTFSTPHGTFLDWIEHESFARVSRRYEGRCLAYAHPTLAAGPRRKCRVADGAPAGDFRAHRCGRAWAWRIAGARCSPPTSACRCGACARWARLTMARRWRARANLPRFLEGHVALLARAPPQKARSDSRRRVVHGAIRRDGSVRRTTRAERDDARQHGVAGAGRHERAAAMVHDRRVIHASRGASRQRRGRRRVRGRAERSRRAIRRLSPAGCAASRNVAAHRARTFTITTISRIRRSASVSIPGCADARVVGLVLLSVSIRGDGCEACRAASFIPVGGGLHPGRIRKSENTERDRQ